MTPWTHQKCMFLPHPRWFKPRPWLISHRIHGAAIYIYMVTLCNIYHQYTPNVRIYTIHGSCGFVGGEDSVGFLKKKTKVQPLTRRFAEAKTKLPRSTQVDSRYSWLNHVESLFLIGKKSQCLMVSILILKSNRHKSVTGHWWSPPNVGWNPSMEICQWHQCLPQKKSASRPMQLLFWPSIFGWLHSYTNIFWIA